MPPVSAHVSPPPRDGEQLAAIDLGSNSFHMIVARYTLGQLRVVDRLRETVRMADGLDGKGGLSQAARERALDCLSRFGQRIRDIPASRVRALATNTVRQLADPQSFLVPAEAALGKPIEVVSGREEARLIYLGVAHAQPPKAGQLRLVIDIGGGSTEFIIGRGLETLERESLQAGCIASTRRFFPGGKLSKKRWKEALTEIAAISTVRRPVPLAGLAGGHRFLRHQQGDRRNLRGDETDQGRGHRRGPAAGPRSVAAGRAHRRHRSARSVQRPPPDHRRRRAGAGGRLRGAGPAAADGQQGGHARRHPVRHAGPRQRQRSA